MYRPMGACATFAHVCLHVSARACVCLCGLGSRHICAERASTFRRRGPLVVRLAGVLRGVGLQRKHRRMEHRVGDTVGLGMRRFRPGLGTCFRGCPRVYI